MQHKFKECLKNVLVENKPGANFLINLHLIQFTQNQLIYSKPGGQGPVYAIPALNVYLDGHFESCC